MLMETLARDDLGDEPRYRWMVLSLAARVQADLALAAQDEGRALPAEVFTQADAVRSEAGSLRILSPTDRGHRALVLAEHARLRREGETTAWRAAAEQWRETHDPVPLAYALFRFAEALSGDGEVAEAGVAAGEALALARAAGAAPLEAEVEALIRRARLPAGSATNGSPRPRHPSPPRSSPMRPSDWASPPARKRSCASSPTGAPTARSPRGCSSVTQDPAQRSRSKHPLQAGRLEPRGGRGGGASAWGLWDAPADSEA